MKLYKEMMNINNYKIAYEQIKSKPGNMTAGVDKETLDGISIGWMEEVIEEMRTREFQFKPSKRIYIQKKDGKLRPLGIPSPRDKIIQRVYLNILEKIYEERFLETSHGFRPNKGCITAIKEIRKWNGAVWMIEGDIKSYFDTIDHHILAEILEKVIKDRDMINLYWKMVKAGYIEEGERKESSIGVPQGGVISPILSNIYLNELDEYMEKIKEEYNTKGELSKQSKAYNKVIGPYRKAVKKYKEEKNLENLEELKEWRKKLLNTPFSEKIGIKIHYIRYADDFIIGIRGTKEIAIEIREKVGKFIKEKLKIELNIEKTKITNSSKEVVKFLGYLIKTTDRKYKSSLLLKKDGIISRSATGDIKLYVPKKDILERLLKRGFIRNDEGVYKGKYFGPWINYTEMEIVIKYRAVIMGYANYYNIVDDYSNVEDIIGILRYSAIHTLAAKYKISIAKIINKFKKSVTVKEGDKTLDLIYKPLYIGKYKEEDPLKSTYYAIRTKLKIEENMCKICGSTQNIEMHHVKHLKDLNPKLSTTDKLMATMKRKQIAVCSKCHDIIHNGTYNGPKIKKIK